MEKETFSFSDPPREGKRARALARARARTRVNSHESKIMRIRYKAAGAPYYHSYKKKTEARKRNVSSARARTKRLSFRRVSSRFCARVFSSLFDEDDEASSAPQSVRLLSRREDKKQSSAYEFRVWSSLQNFIKKSGLFFLFKSSSTASYVE